MKYSFSFLLILLRAGINYQLGFTSSEYTVLDGVKVVDQWMNTMGLTAGMSF